MSYRSTDLLEWPISLEYHKKPLSLFIWILCDPWLETNHLKNTSTHKNLLQKSMRHIKIACTLYIYWKNLKWYSTHHAFTSTCSSHFNHGPIKNLWKWGWWYSKFNFLGSKILHVLLCHNVTIYARWFLLLKV